MRPIREGKRAIQNLFGVLGSRFLRRAILARWMKQSVDPPRSTQEDVHSVVEGNNEFALNLLARLGTDRSANLFFSPESLSASLAMTYAGASGQTAEQMSEAITRNAPFHVSTFEQTDVPLMFQKEHFRYWAGDGLQVLDFPYGKGKGDLAMIVLLPDEVEDSSPRI